MIDGFKTWNAKTNLEIENFNYNGLRLNRNPDGGYCINGSLHKFSNDGLHNANDYFLSDFKNTLNRLFDDIGLNPDITNVNGFEFGVNIKLPMNPNNTLNRLILHKSNAGAVQKNYKEFGYKNYSFKIYNKSELTDIEPYQYENIMRVEVKVYRMEHVKKVLTYKRLSDLLDVAVWERLETLLIETVNECLIVDFSEKEKNKLSEKEKNKYLKYINRTYWIDLHNDLKKYSRERERCNKFVKLHSKSTLKTDIINLISVKCKELRDEKTTNEIIKKWDKLTVFETEKKIQKCPKLTTRINEQFSPSDTYENDNVKCCKSCGKIIQNPRVNQSYCSAKVVGYNQAHKCRNSNSNPRNNAKKTIRRILSIPLMFDLADSITPEERKFL
ncbi:MAG: hypothetical protein ACOYMA_18380 [Bacteroidia bacterium]